VSQDWIRRSKNSPFVTNKLDILRIKKKKKNREKKEKGKPGEARPHFL
jgi:hypothetical protein